MGQKGPLNANKCPCCGQSVEFGGILLSLDTNSISYKGKTVRLHATEAEIACVLVERAPIVARREFIVTRVWGVNERETTARKNLDVQIMNLRRKVAPIGLNIKTIRSVGYQLEGASNDRG